MGDAPSGTEETQANLSQKSKHASITFFNFAREHQTHRFKSNVAGKLKDVRRKS